MGAWWDREVVTHYLRKPGGAGPALVLELVSQSRPLFDSADRHAWACCTERRTVVRVVGEITAGPDAERLLVELRRVGKALSPVERRRGRTPP